MTIEICPKCGKDSLIFYPKLGFKVDFDLSKANQKITCSNCKRIISYSIQPIDASQGGVKVTR